MSGSSLIKSAGAKSRQALVFAAVVMAVVILLFSSAVSEVALPALAGLIMLVGYRTIKPDDVRSVAKTGSVQAVVLAVTFVLTLVIPLQYAVVMGVALSVDTRRDQPVESGRGEVACLRRRRLGPRGPPAPGGACRHCAGSSAVRQLVLRLGHEFRSRLACRGRDFTRVGGDPPLRGRTDLGGTFMDVLRRYAQSLLDVGSKLVIVSADERVIDQLAATGFSTSSTARTSTPGTSGWVDRCGAPTTTR